METGREPLRKRNTSHTTLIASTIMQTMTGYVHGYGTPEQERLVEQAEHWRHRLIRDGTQLEPGTPLLEIVCGVGAGLEDLRSLAGHPGAGLGSVLHKSTAVR